MWQCRAAISGLMSYILIHKVCHIALVCQQKCTYGAADSDLSYMRPHLFFFFRKYLKWCRWQNTVDSFWKEYVMWATCRHKRELTQWKEEHACENTEWTMEDFNPPDWLRKPQKKFHSEQETRSLVHSNSSHHVAKFNTNDENPKTNLDL